MDKDEKIPGRRKYSVHTELGIEWNIHDDETTLSRTLDYKLKN